MLWYEGDAVCHRLDVINMHRGMTEHGLLLRRTLESQRVLKRHHNAMANQKRLETSFSSANFSLSFSHSFRCRASTHIQYNTNTMLRIFVQRRHTMTSLSLSGFSFSFTIHNVPTVRAVVGFPHLLELPVSVTTLGLFFSLSLSLSRPVYTFTFWNPCTQTGIYSTQLYW